MALEEIGFQAVVKGLGSYKASTSTIERENDSVTKSTQRASAASQAFQRIAVGAAVVGATAVLGLGAAALKMATDFDKGMREVNTLLRLPEAQLNQLKDDTLELAKTIGVDTRDAVRALYQAISAGVPRENAITFLETAGKAAIGGVTTLEVAVDGLTTVVNSYGAEVISAERASDIMFQTVNLGKVEFDELAQFLAQVVPTAVAAGVSFEEVSAAIASITKQGTPVRVATTNLRQLLVELQKPGATLAPILEKTAKDIGAVSGSFKDLKATGLPLQEILLAIGRAAEAEGKSFTQVLSSVEAANAALQLTSRDGKIAAEDLIGVTNSAGSAQFAFEELNRSAARQAEIFRSQLNVALTRLGSAVLPVVAKGISGVNANFPALVSAVETLAAGLSELFGLVNKNRTAFAAFVLVLASPAIFRGVSGLIDLTATTIQLARQGVPALQLYARNLVILTRLGGISGLVTALGTLGGPLALGAVAVGIAAVVIGGDKLLGLFGKGESASARLSRRFEELQQRLKDVDRSLTLGRIEDYEATNLRVNVAIEAVTESLTKYQASLRQLARLQELSGRDGLSDAEVKRLQERATNELNGTLEDFIRKNELSAIELEAVRTVLERKAESDANAKIALDAFNIALENTAPAAQEVTSEVKAATKEVQAALDPNAELADRLEDVARGGEGASKAIKSYDDRLKGLNDTLTVDQLQRDEEIASLKLRQKELELSGLAESREAAAIRERIQVLQDLTEKEELERDVLIAKGRTREFERTSAEASIRTDEDLRRAIEEVVKATGLDIEAEGGRSQALDRTVEAVLRAQDANKKLAELQKEAERTAEVAKDALIRRNEAIREAEGKDAKAQADIIAKANEQYDAAAAAAQAAAAAVVRAQAEASAATADAKTKVDNLAAARDAEAQAALDAAAVKTAAAAETVEADQREVQSLDSVRDAADLVGKSLFGVFQKAIQIDDAFGEGVVPAKGQLDDLATTGENTAERIANAIDSVLLPALKAIGTSVEARAEQISDLAAAIAALPPPAEIAQGATSTGSAAPGGSASVPGRAAGGPALPGNLYRINESAGRLGELFSPRVPGLVMRPQQVIGGAAQGGGGGLNVHIHGPVNVISPRAPTGAVGDLAFSIQTALLQRGVLR